MEQQRDKVWTAANIVTLIRLLCIPVFVAVVVSPWPQWFPQFGEMDMWKPIIAAAVFIAISCTDAIDGHLARSRNEVTTLGKFMDPLADKILVAAALLCLIELNVLPSWPALIILAREFIVSGIRMVAASEGVVIAASWWGKVKTVTQIIAVVLFLVKASLVTGMLPPDMNSGLYVLAWIAMSIALIFTIVSMLDYFAKARTLLGFSEGSGTFAPAARRATAKAPVVPAADGTAVLAEDDADCAALNALAAEVIAAARAHGKTVGTAESLTGGLIGGALTAVPGSSDVTEGGIISYSNEVKHALLSVAEETLAAHGAVSGQTACEMAQGAREALGVDMAVSVTGIAGPGGAVPGKPVGTVWIGVSDGTQTVAKRYLFDGDRAQVRAQTVQSALELLLTALNDETLVSDQFA